MIMSPQRHESLVRTIVMARFAIHFSHIYSNFIWATVCIDIQLLYQSAWDKKGPGNECDYDRQQHVETDIADTWTESNGFKSTCQ